MDEEILEVLQIFIESNTMFLAKIICISFALILQKRQQYPLMIFIKW